MKYSASAPSNIALIKYMGKVGTGNVPANASLSYTLEEFRSFVELSPATGATDEWQPLSGAEMMPLSLSQAGLTKLLNFVGKLKAELGVQGHFLIKTANNFPSDCGIASSASSFAALTLAFAKVAAKQSGKDGMDMRILSEVSRQGSGSSCRSFFSPWSIWRSGGGEPVPTLANSVLLHDAIVVDDGIKRVSSSQAHQRVQTSLLYNGRAERAQKRIDGLLPLLVSPKLSEWRSAFEICWAEYWDMHCLFHTSEPSFSYINAKTVAILDQLQNEFWPQQGDGPVVTLDAGPNIHLLWRQDQQSLREKFFVSIGNSGYQRLIGHRGSK